MRFVRKVLKSNIRPKFSVLGASFRAVGLAAIEAQGGNCVFKLCVCVWGGVVGVKSKEMSPNRHLPFSHVSVRKCIEAVKRPSKT